MKTSAVRFVAFLALVSIVLHLILGWDAYQNDHGAPQFGEYMIEWGRDTFENWQSEFIQLAVQFALLAGLLSAIGIRVHEEDMEKVNTKLDALQDSIDRVEEDTVVVRYSGILDPPKERANP
jgi:hypothetical protein